jgi:hypothetical protein
MGDAKYLGKIVRTYVQGSVIPVTVVVSLEIIHTLKNRSLMF